MATDTSFGEVRKFEDFLVTALVDIPEIDIQSAESSTEIVSGAVDGRVQLAMGTGNSDESAAVAFNLNWTAGDGYLKMEARIILSATTDNCYFVGFGDQIPSTEETIIFAPADVVTTGTQSDCIGILFDQDATTKNLWCVAQAGDSITLGKVQSSIYNPTASTPTTLGVYLSVDRKSAQFYVDGKEIYRIDNSSVLVDAVDLVPGVWAFEQATAFNLDVDYLYAAKGRSAT